MHNAPLVKHTHPKLTHTLLPPQALETNMLRDDHGGGGACLSHLLATPGSLSFWRAHVLHVATTQSRLIPPSILPSPPRTTPQTQENEYLRPLLGIASQS